VHVKGDIQIKPLLREGREGFSTLLREGSPEHAEEKKELHGGSYTMRGRRSTLCCPSRRGEKSADAQTSPYFGEKGERESFEHESMIKEKKLAKPFRVSRRGGKKSLFSQP